MVPVLSQSMLVAQCRDGGKGVSLSAGDRDMELCQRMGCTEGWSEVYLMPSNPTMWGKCVAVVLGGFGGVLVGRSKIRDGCGRRKELPEKGKSSASSTRDGTLSTPGLMSVHTLTLLQF